MHCSSLLGLKIHFPKSHHSICSTGLFHMVRSLNQKLYHLDKKKQGDFRKFLCLLALAPLWYVAQWAFRAPPHHTLPAFLNLNAYIPIDNKLGNQDCFSKLIRRLYENFTKCQTNLVEFKIFIVGAARMVRIGWARVGAHCVYFDRAVWTCSRNLAKVVRLWLTDIFFCYFVS